MSSKPQHNPLSPTSKIEYISPCTVTVNLPFILTTDRKLTIGLPYLYLEGSHISAVNVLDVWDADKYVNIKIQDLKTGQITTLQWSQDYLETYWLWSLTSFDWLQTIVNEKGGTY